MNKRLVATYTAEVRRISRRISTTKSIKKDNWRKWLINQYLQKVVEIAGQFYPKVANEISLLDLIQAGNVGLIEAVDNYIKSGKKAEFDPQDQIQTRIEIFLERENRQSIIEPWAL